MTIDWLAEYCSLTGPTNQSGVMEDERIVVVGTEVADTAIYGALHLNDKKPT